MMNPMMNQATSGGRNTGYSAAGSFQVIPETNQFHHRVTHSYSGGPIVSGNNFQHNGRIPLYSPVSLTLMTFFSPTIDCTVSTPTMRGQALAQTPLPTTSTSATLMPFQPTLPRTCLLTISTSLIRCTSSTISKCIQIQTVGV